MSSQPTATALLQQKQQALLLQQHAEQQQENAEQQHSEQQQSTEQQQQDVEQQQQQHTEQQGRTYVQQHEHGLPVVGTTEMAEALGRLCQAATRKQRLAHARPEGKASSSGGSSPASRRHSPESRTADATSSGRSTPQHQSHGRSQHSRRGLAGSTCSTPTGSSPDKLISNVPNSTAGYAAVHMTSTGGSSRDSGSDSGTGSAQSGSHASPGAAAVARSEQLLRAFVEVDTQARNVESTADEARVAMPGTHPVTPPSGPRSSRQEPAHPATAATNAAAPAADVVGATIISADDDDVAAAANSRAVRGGAAVQLLLPGAMQEGAVPSASTSDSSFTVLQRCLRVQALAMMRPMQLQNQAALPVSKLQTPTRVLLMLVILR